MRQPLDTSVYIHFPWCRRKCPYCDFVSYRTDDDDIGHSTYADAVCAELDARAPSLEDRRLVSVFFGGGTPSLWEPGAVGRVLREVSGGFAAVAPDVEVTVECNPSSLDRPRAEALREAGVGRLSIGVQSTDDRHLRFLGRLHDAAEGLAAVAAAVAAVPRVSADLMFGMPGQTLGELKDDLRRLLDTGVRHISAYALTVEAGTQLGELVRLGKTSVSEEEAYAEMFERVERVLEGEGLSHYEVSNYGAPGEESRHNVHTWRGGDYVGLGAAAVGCLREAPGAARRWKNTVDPARYLSAPRTPEQEHEHLGPQEIVREALMLGLRTREGTDLRGARRRAGVDPRAGREHALARAVEAGDLLDEGDRLRVPTSRWLRLDGIVAALF